MRNKRPRGIEQSISIQSWNCFNDSKNKHEYFLAQKPNLPSQPNDPIRKHTQHKRNNSGIDSLHGDKISLRQKKQRSLKGSQQLVTVEEQLAKESQSPTTKAQMGDQSWFNIQDHLFIRAPQSVRTTSQTNQLKIDQSPRINWNIHAWSPPTSAKITFTLLSPPAFATTPQSTFSNEKQERGTVQKDESQKTTVVASSSTSMKLIKLELDEEYEKKVSDIRTPPSLKLRNKTPSFQEEQKEKDKLRRTQETPNPTSPHLSHEQKNQIKLQKPSDKNVQRQLTTFSLLTPPSLAPQKKFGLKELSYSCSNFKSQRFKPIQKKRVARMSQVEEIKSLADSNQSNDEDDKQSIVLGRLEEMSALDAGSMIAKGASLISDKKEVSFFSSVRLNNLK